MCVCVCVSVCVCVCFFFSSRRRHTRLVSDWSSDVCSSDLIRDTGKGEFIFVQQKILGRPTAELLQEMVPSWVLGLEGNRFMRWGDGDQIGRASCRERV